MTLAASLSAQRRDMPDMSADPYPTLEAAMAVVQDDANAVAAKKR
jgi:hypothetical protein